MQREALEKSKGTQKKLIIKNDKINLIQQPMKQIQDYDKENIPENLLISSQQPILKQQLMAQNYNLFAQLQKSNSRSGVQSQTNSQHESSNNSGMISNLQSFENTGNMTNRPFSSSNSFLSSAASQVNHNHNHFKTVRLQAPVQNNQKNQEYFKVNQQQTNNTTASKTIS